MVIIAKQILRLFHSNKKLVDTKNPKTELGLDTMEKEIRNEQLDLNVYLSNQINSNLISSDFLKALRVKTVIYDKEFIDYLVKNMMSSIMKTKLTLWGETEFILKYMINQLEDGVFYKLRPLTTDKQFIDPDTQMFQYCFGDKFTKEILKIIDKRRILKKGKEYFLWPKEKIFIETYAVPVFLILQLRAALLKNNIHLIRYFFYEQVLNYINENKLKDFKVSDIISQVKKDFDNALSNTNESFSDEFTKQLEFVKNMYDFNHKKECDACKIMEEDFLQEIKQ